MKLRKRLLPAVLALCVLLGMCGTAFAASYSGDAVKPGLSGIQKEDTLTFPGSTLWATLTANWGVRVNFVDWDENTVLKSEVVPVSDTEPGSTSAPEDPTRDGWTFTGWERCDAKRDNNVTLKDDGTVTNVTGPGPIVFIAKYTENKPEPDPEPTPTPDEPDPDPEVGKLKVSKTVEGEAGETDREFSFTVTLSKTYVSGKHGDMTFKKGVATFTLKDGESKTAKDLPAGAEYTVVEDDYSEDGYETEATGDTGKIKDGKTAEASFTNTKVSVENLGTLLNQPEQPADEPVTPQEPGEEPAPAPGTEEPVSEPEPAQEPAPKPADPATPKTGDNSALGFWMMFLLASAAGLTTSVICGKKKKRNN